MKDKFELLLFALMVIGYVLSIYFEFVGIDNEIEKPETYLFSLS